MTWPSFFAASISAGVTGSGGGASANTRVENAAPARTAPVPLSTLRLEIKLFIDVSIGLLAVAVFGLVLVGSGTPHTIFYSNGAQPVFRRQPIGIAAKVAAKNNIEELGVK